jgi:hypothetical protein
MNSLDLGRAFKAPFADKNWVSKTLLGFVWLLLGVTAPAVYGAQLEYIVGSAKGDDTLPDWSDFGNKWVKGFMVLVAMFIYMLPVFIISGIFLIPVVLSAGNNSDAMAALAAGGTCVWIAAVIVYGIAASIFVEAAMVHYAMRGTFSAFFEFGEIISKVRGGTGYFTAWLYALIISAAGSAVTSVLSATGIGAILYPAVLYLMMMATAHVLGQWARAAYGVATPAATPTYAAPPEPAWAPAPPAPPVAPLAPPVAPSAPPVAPPAPPAAPVAPVEPAAPVIPADVPPAAPTTPAPEGDELDPPV